MATTELAPTSPAIEPIAAKKYTAEQVQQALVAMAVAGGNSKAASRRLAEVGFPISDNTLRAWRNRVYPNRYQQIAETYGKQIEQSVVAFNREIAVQAAEGTIEAIQLERRRVEQGKVKDAAGSARNLATAGGIATDKLLALTERPSSITEHRLTADEHVAKLLRMGARETIDTTVEDIEDAELVQ